jgi:hypothetical protein
MSKSKLVVISVCFITSFLYGQDKYSLQVSGGFIFPANTEYGLITRMQINYKYDEIYSFYFAAGYSTWENNHVQYTYRNPTSTTTGRPGNEEFRITFNEFDHYLIPVSFGSKFIVSANKYFSGFMETEIGVNYLQYKKQKLFIQDNPDGSSGIAPHNIKNQETINELLFSIGFGAGIMRKVRNCDNVTIGFRITPMINVGHNSSFYFGYALAMG